MSEENAKRDYEIMLLLSPDLGEDAVGQEIKTLKDHIAEAGGEVTFEDDWGMRKLAYRIKKHEHGYYYVLLFSVDGSFIAPLEKELLLNKNILRHLITIPPKEYQPITSGEVEAGEDQYFTEMRAKKAGMRKRQPAKSTPTPAPATAPAPSPAKDSGEKDTSVSPAPAKEVLHEKEKESEKMSAEERAKKLDDILGDL